MARLFDTLNSILRLKKALGYAALTNAVKSKFALRELTTPTRKNILILSPHPDDDVFGMGGTMNELVRNKNTVKVVYLTSGIKGTETGSRDTKLTGLRHDEAVKACSILGVTDLDFWTFEEGSIANNKGALKSLISLIEVFKPDVICLPSVFDDNADHVAANRLLSQFLAKSDIKELAIWGYEIWTPGFYNRLSDIADNQKIKYKACRHHKSQQQSRDYLKAIQALDQYRGKINGFRDGAESFLVTGPKIYLELVKKRHLE